MITVTVEERELINEIIKKNKVCYVGMVDTEGMPYVIPMNFGFDAGNDIIYLHSGPDGSSVSAIEKNPNLCITFCTEPKLIYQHKDVACSYRMKCSSVICRGKVVFEEDLDKKREALNFIMQQYSKSEFKYSDPAVKNVKIWRVELDSISTKVFGAPNPKSPNYKDQDFAEY
ncbi:pyridoxamine 5'-phosphate oxidase family protein [Dysgonomonas sp. 216]|uniref:pyridoxamine 5'-phosphate oxidase family protein n=1 Tax=Dysgonomonas sp. 216 TaxID=2302934 RepID=UPI0013D74004|nr:pyridoxamine 5'-phosphate oxidase family protein [Dysgonomonas sp. 216]NDW18966.1 pyridoxamine 5'-phosphate oxidase family protein [Dysgonomonas sp. 216]